MYSTSPKPNVFVVQNGKLVPKETQQEEKKSYRYVPYDSANNPQPEDYFRETITKLNKENNTLRNELDRKLGELSMKHVNQMKCPEAQIFQEEISVLRAHLAKKTQELENKNKTIKNQDKQIHEINQENQLLHARIGNVMKELEFLNDMIQTKDEEIIDKKLEIEEYCKSIEKLTMKEKEEGRTMHSSHCEMTPRADEREDYFVFEKHSNEGERRYMTPDVHMKMDENSHMYRSQNQRTVRNYENLSSDWGTACYGSKVNKEFDIYKR